ncbi:glycosyltransferase [Luteibacter rhizovicinus DSM 16549]|uniref:Glycosyltransferase n=1 Tax=Luteibacter rhizovicinus DSM 16549 TaxID=1440763 RepID=A0A0G9H9Y6_9GAMM|nr:glycosyltransferase family 2 protein [Luteibacter rhizovicinus]APG04444.1 glycosyltransferase [Luteibacter rhizovicinus DSM 16549]KLD66256.1 glycosyl transferase [Luteibacter rhizovicinus DSM 16549]KLD79092.1 glycosyl transferase [Xanthomonas hyacinthi DSM 19077]
MTSLPLISIAIPVYNEEGNIAALYQRLDALATTMANECRLEFVFSDNSSTDTTWSMLEALAAKDERVRAIRFSKNFGFQRSIMANYLHTRGDAVLQIDADLQDPPELLKDFLALWRQGYHVVYGVRRSRPEGKFIHSFRKIGYWVIDRISEHPIPRNAGDFRLVDRKVIDALEKQRSAEPYLRGLIAGMGFRQIGVTYDRSARVAGSSKFGVAQLIRLGLTGVFNHSLVPLRLATVAGIVILSLSALGTVYYLVLKLLFPDFPRGLASLHILILFGIGFQSLLLGILGEYLLRIYRILRKEPIAIIQDSLNLDSNDIKL